eukprot:2519761-Prymnesium_polylepis.1
MGHLRDRVRHVPMRGVVTEPPGHEVFLERLRMGGPPKAAPNHLRSGPPSSVMAPTFSHRTW